MTDIRSIIARMTLEEKAALCTGATAWTTAPVERLGVPELFVSDGPHGVRRVPDKNSMALDSLPATCFPTASGTASSWDTDLLRQLGEALGAELVARPRKQFHLPVVRLAVGPRKVLPHQVCIGVAGQQGVAAVE